MVYAFGKLIRQSPLSGATAFHPTRISHGRSVLSLWGIVVLGVILLSSPAIASEQLQAGGARVSSPDAVAGSTTAESLEEQADQLHAAKRYFEAADYYHAALAKQPDRETLHNKLGMVELFSQRFRTAKADFERSIKLNRQYAPAYNNLGVLEYLQRKYSKAVKRYQEAIRLQGGVASYYRNLGATYFAKKQWAESTEAYSRALALDPDVFERNSGAGVAGQVASPEDHARFSYVLASCMPGNGLADRSLACLRRARMNAVYSDAEFSTLRKDPRFVELMADPPRAISQ
jgi:tetratricopeptide (TPR) repeat protein